MRFILGSDLSTGRRRWIIRLRHMRQARSRTGEIRIENGKALKSEATNTDTNLEAGDDSKSVFIDITFTVLDSPDRVQSLSASDTISIPEDPAIKGIFCHRHSGASVSCCNTNCHRHNYDWYTQIPVGHAGQKGGYSCWTRRQFKLNERLDAFKCLCFMSMVLM